MKTNNENDIKVHLQNRGIDFAKTKVILDTEKDVATFLLYNLSGQLIGYQLYNPKGDKKLNGRKKGNNTNQALKDLMKYYTRVSDIQKGTAVYGLETYDNTNEFLFITEGIFDCIKIHNAGYPAIATLANAGSKELATWLMMLPQKIVAIVDNDESGKELIKIADYYFNSPQGFKDLGDAPQKIVNILINSIVEELQNKTKTRSLKE